MKLWLHVEVSAPSILTPARHAVIGSEIDLDHLAGAALLEAFAEGTDRSVKKVRGSKLQSESGMHIYIYINFIMFLENGS